MHFGENQLSLSSIGISPLPTAHPSRFQPTLVRSSTPHYRGFNLAMGRSLSFGSTTCNYAALFGLGFPSAPGSSLNLATDSNSPVHYAKGTPSYILLAEHSTQTACRRYGFSFSFTPLPGCFSPFSHGTGSLSVTTSI